MLTLSYTPVPSPHPSIPCAQDVKQLLGAQHQAPKHPRWARVNTIKRNVADVKAMLEKQVRRAKPWGHCVVVSSVNLSPPQPDCKVILEKRVRRGKPCVCVRWGGGVAPL